jgi:hypothetical protein
MNKTALQDIQRTLNIIRNQIDAVDAETKWAALELMLASSTSVVSLAKKDDQARYKNCNSHNFYSQNHNRQTACSEDSQSNGNKRTQNLKATHLFVLKSRYPINEPINKRLKIMQ